MLPNNITLEGGDPIPSQKSRSETSVSNENNFIKKVLRARKRIFFQKKKKKMGIEH